MVSGGVAAPGASPLDPAAVRNPLPHSSFSVTRRNSALTCSVGELLVGVVLQRKGDRGDQLVLAVDDAEVEPAGRGVLHLQAGGRDRPSGRSRRTRRAGGREARADARMRRILEHSHLDALDRFVARELAGTERAQVAAADAGDEGLRVGVETDARPHLVPAHADRQPFVRRSDRAARCSRAARRRPPASPRRDTLPRGWPGSDRSGRPSTPASRRDGGRTRAGPGAGTSSADAAVAAGTTWSSMRFNACWRLTSPAACDCTNAFSWFNALCTPRPF